MKKEFKFLMMVLLGLFVGAGTMWADETTIYLASLKAQTDPASTGSGQVKLTWLDITGKPMVNSIAVGAQGLNPTNPVGPAETAQMVAGTMIAIEGTEVAKEIGGTGSQIYMTSMVYFHAEAEPADGSYLADWTFTDPQITRMTSSMTIPDPMGDGSEERPYRTPCFKVLPKLENSAAYPSMEVYAKVTAVTADPNNIYALFSKYLLSNPVATNAVLEATPNAEANLTVTVEINGEAASLDAADFGAFTFANNDNNEWTYDLSSALASKEEVSAQKTRITIPVTYTYKKTGFGLKNTTMTISMAGASPSTLNVNLSVNALDPERPEAFLLEGKDDENPESGTLAAILGTDISGYSDPIIKLNKPVATDLTFSGKDFTLDLNGNTTQAITVSSGKVTIAYSKYGGEATSLTVNGGKAILNGGTFGSLSIGANGTVEQNGATITGAANNAGSLTTTEGTINGGLTSSKTLVLNGGTFKGTTAVTISSGTAAINRGTIDGTTCGLKVTGGAATTKKLAAIKGATYSAQQTGGTLTVESGKFDGPLNGTIEFTAGFFKNVGDTVGLSAGKTGMLVSAGVEYNEGYRYFLGTSESALANGVGVCRIGTTSYARLEDAIAYANNNPSVAGIVIFMTNNYTLPAGYYTLPANATIVVPMSDSQEKEVNMTAPRIIFNDVNKTTPYTSIQPTEFRRLTFASGVNMNVFGQIEMTCSQYASNEAYTAQPVGAYGHLVLEEGSSVTLQSGSEVRAWGFVTGKGEMDARRGAKVREMFQLGDWKGAFTSVRITGMFPTIGDDSEKKIFPVTQYFIQNIESPVKYHPGAVLSTSAAVSEGLLGMSVSMAATDIAIVGVSGQHQAIFLMDQMADADNTWVRKWYDSENDIQVYDINSAAHIGSMVLDMGDINLLTYGTVPIRLNSAKFDLPLTSNFKIHLLSGTMDFLQNTSLLPGAVVEVDKEATVTVAMDTTERKAYDAWVAGGKEGDAPVCYTGALYVYDAEEWDKYAFCGNVQVQEEPAYTKTVRYAASWNGRPTVRDEQTKPADAAINVHGTFRTATGFVYCSEHGANIFSSNEDAGTFVFNQSAAAAGTRTVYNVKGSGTFEDLTFYPAKLKNGVADPAFANTDTANKDDAYCYTDDKWNIFKQSGCFMKDGYDVYYAKPQEYVALANGTIPNTDNTYSDAAGAGRLFILMENGCQWWEVEKKDNLYHCIHPDNDTYYYWVDAYYDEKTDEDILAHWEEKRFTITWLNWNGDTIKSVDYSDPENPDTIDYSVTYGTMAEFLGTNPTRKSNIDYTYDFTGWTPALGKVTSDVTYTATYTEKPRMYTIIFRQEGGLEIERQFLKHNEVPVCENTPTKPGHTLVWSPAIAAVTGDATYTATWLENPPTEYEVTFYDYNGEDTLQQSNVAVGAMPVAPAIVNGKPQKEDESFGGKPATNEFTYVFDHWSPALEEVSATSIKSYTAVYAEVAKKYTVIFQDEEGDEIERHQYQYGETPVCSEVPTKAATAQYTYKLRWEPQIQTVMADATYKAVFDETLNKYTVSVMSNPSGACAISGAGIYDYNTSATITLDVNDGYTFTGWSDGQGGTNTTRQMAVTGDINLVANFTVATPDWTITWKNEAGTANLIDPVGQKANTATIYTGAIPTKTATAQYTYTFDGWTTSPNGAGTFYKNNMTPKATANATYYAHFAATEVVMEVGLGQAQDIAEATTVNQLIINSNGMVSGQLTGDINNILNVTGACYYDLTGTFTAGKWYAVAVPWRVTASDIRANGNALSWMSGDYLAYYDGSVRAAQGTVDACWKYVTNGSTLEPGRLYMLYLANNASLLRFPKKSGAPILNASTNVTTYAASDATDANWNGIANPAIFYAYLNNTGATVGQVFNADAQSYEAVALSNKLIVAKPIFVQATNNGSATAVTTPPTSAPIRRNANVETQKAECQVTITSRGRMQDRLFIHADENKEADTYTVGQDVLKFGVSSSVAQMWVNRYDAKLCMNTMAPVNNVAEFPLSIYAPKDGDYTIAIEKEQVTDDYALYLTYNGEAIWNLSDGAYTANLEKGTDANYGLRFTFKAPEVATGIDEAIVDSKDATAAKVLINGHVFIIREGAVYTINGQLVK